ncbi:redoxin domain-containing protein [Sphaerisporangium sp. TRM90804]|uniref:TlpA family protein disulfide reductase n=1 Tax=Sphaerisporangium sp. TRM90804 TaxID=3031113 RepID=UPI00244D3B81|nr:redoxin domain-containing protein [Sphaerisporangium sp. TRM90804]MDH2425453.1 redoxin domain-containing protein [Sphaerisporangium sp. TRM90804]
MLRVRTAVAALVAGLMVTACGGAGRGEAVGEPPGDTPLSATVEPLPEPDGGRGTGRSATPAADPSRTPGPAATVPPALKFTATTLGGDPFRGASLAGRPVVFWFWAPWCPKCLSEAPAVKRAAAKYGDVAFVGVAGLDTEEAMKEFVRRTGTGTIVQLSDEKGAVWSRLGVTSQSTFVFMRPDGSTEKASGPLGADELDAHVRELRAA